MSFEQRLRRYGAGASQSKVGFWTGKPGCSTISRSSRAYHLTKNLYVLQFVSEASGDTYHRSRVVGPTVVCNNNCTYNGQVCLCGT